MRAKTGQLKCGAVQQNKKHEGWAHLKITTKHILVGKRRVGIFCFGTDHEKMAVIGIGEHSCDSAFRQILWLLFWHR